jgi:hypothetical protein
MNEILCSVRTRSWEIEYKKNTHVCTNKKKESMRSKENEPIRVKMVRNDIIAEGEAPGGVGDLR